MKANELMFDDWVFCEGQPTPSNVRIKNIADDGVWFEGDKYEGAAFYDRIFPIPLTPEILEKNFEKKTFYGIYDDYFDLDIREYSDSVYVATFHNCEMHTPDQQMTFSFVHELQHFLNHCGIEKEIEL